MHNDFEISMQNHLFKWSTFMQDLSEINLKLAMKKIDIFKTQSNIHQKNSKIQGIPNLCSFFL